MLTVCLIGVLGPVLVQAFDRDRNGTLHVSDFADLLRNLQELGNSPVVAEGIEAAIDKMDKDHSGQVTNNTPLNK